MIPTIHKHLLTAVIAPHGITDIIHATKHNATTELVAWNGASLASSWFLSQHIPIILDEMFIIASIVHFRHDMPVLGQELARVPKYVLSGALLFASIRYDPNILFGYMVLLHVPNHYIMNWKFMKDEPYQNIGLVVAFSLLLVFSGEYFPWIFDSQLLFDMSKGIIVSHVIYNEKNIHNRATTSF